jgi:hypothetical protein
MATIAKSLPIPARGVARPERMMAQVGRLIARVCAPEFGATWLAFRSAWEELPNDWSDATRYTR